MWFIVCILLLFCIIFIIFSYYRLTIQIKNIQISQKQLNTGLEKRYKVLETFIRIIKKHKKEEPDLEKILLLHNQSEQAKIDGKDKQRIQVENQISDLASSLPLIANQYPELNTDPQSLQIQQEMIHIQKNLAYAKEAYSDNVDIYYVNKNAFPLNFIVTIFPSVNKEFSDWHA
jgi:LemA protein